MLLPTFGGYNMFQSRLKYVQLNFSACISWIYSYSVKCVFGCWWFVYDTTKGFNRTLRRHSIWFKLDLFVFGRYQLLFDFVQILENLVNFRKWSSSVLFNSFKLRYSHLPMSNWFRGSGRSLFFILGLGERLLRFLLMLKPSMEMYFLICTYVIAMVYGWSWKNILCSSYVKHPILCPFFRLCPRSFYPLHCACRSWHPRRVGGCNFSD